MHRYMNVIGLCYWSVYVVTHYIVEPSVILINECKNKYVVLTN